MGIDCKYLCSGGQTEREIKYYRKKVSKNQTRVLFTKLFPTSSARM